MVRAALLFVGFYGILVRRKALSCKCSGHAPSSASLSVCRQEEVQFFVILLTVQMFLHENPKEESIMDILNIVFSALNLLATVIIGVINVTWMISRDVFRDKPQAKHYSKK